MKLIKLTLIPILVIALGLAYYATLQARTKTPSFHGFLKEIQTQALKRGISKETTEKYLMNLKAPAHLKHNATTHLETHQAQVVDTFQSYFTSLITPEKIRRARTKYKQYHSLLMRVYARYHVQPQFIIALWGIESDFGRDTGSFPLMHSLAILAYNHYHDHYFREQLISALIILNNKHVIPQQLKSAFDGGMGQPQFEPSTYIAFAVDFDHSGFKNIWTSLPDTFASIANFLHQNNWDGHTGWGMPVKVPAHFNLKRAGRYHLHPATYWSAQGVTQTNGKALPTIKGQTAILLPDGIKGPAFIVFHNFFVLLQWNDTTFEGLTVGLLAHKISSLNGNMHDD